MWILTVYSKEKTVTTFEFEEKKEAINFQYRIEDYTILSEVIYFNDFFQKQKSV